MKAKNLNHFASGPAPDEWRKIPEINMAKPVAKGEISLQKLDRFNICYWMIRTGVYWKPASDFFYVK